MSWPHDATTPPSPAGAEMRLIGRPWTLHLDIRGDGVPTIRHTTFVRQVVADPSN
jgi:hypothetical protein